jgi:hypothetical protein
MGGIRQMWGNRWGRWGLIVLGEGVGGEWDVKTLVMFGCRLLYY